jgi:hypothetical protein
MSASISDLKNKVEECFRLKKEKEDLEDLVAKTSKLLEQKKKEILDVLDQSGLDGFDVPELGKVYTRVTTNVSMPKDPDKKKEFMDYLKQKELTDFLTVNHQTLNAWYREELDKAVEIGNDSFSIPGLDEPKAFKTIALKGKTK